MSCEREKQDYETALRGLPSFFAGNARNTVDLLIMEYDQYPMSMQDKCSLVRDNMLGIFFLYPEQLGQEYPEKRVEAETLFDDLQSHLIRYGLHEIRPNSKDETVLGIQTMCSSAARYIDRWQMYNKLFGE
ncbi:hypothetical protein ACFL96_05190 [Thermoproteota archaeon]